SPGIAEQIVSTVRQVERKA
ncbi:hypothetical protein Tsp_03360, partial [Trichinella spiralis]